MTKRPVFETLILGCVGEAVEFSTDLDLIKDFSKCFKTKKTYPKVPKMKIMAVSDTRWLATFAKEGGNNTLSPIIMVQWKKWLDI